MPAFMKLRYYDSSPRKHDLALPGQRRRFQQFEDAVTGEQRIIVVGCAAHDNVTTVREGSADLLDDSYVDFSEMQILKELLHRGSYKRELRAHGIPLGVFTVNHLAILAPSRYEPDQANYDWPELIECSKDNILPLQG